MLRKAEHWSLTPMYIGTAGDDGTVGGGGGNGDGLSGPAMNAPTPAAGGDGLAWKRPNYLAVE